MVNLGLVVGASWSFLNGIVFFIVGYQVSQRRLTGEEKRANQLFALFWTSLGALSAAGAAFNLAAAWGITDLALYTVLLYTLLLVLCVSLWGLAYYLIYLFTGDRRWLLPLGVFYAAYFFFILYLVVWARPTALELGRWQTQIQYERDLSGEPMVQALVLLLLVPQILGAIAYMSLLFKVRGRVQRYRILLVSSSILVWFGAGMVASVLEISRSDWWQATNRLISLAAAFTVLFAFSPPRSVREWLEKPSRPLVAGGVVR